MPGFATRAIRAASRIPKAPQSPINVPIYASSTFEVGSAAELAELLEFARPGHSYTRYSNPTHAALEDALAELEGAEACLVTASGMAAAHAVVLATVRSGEELLLPQAVYGGMVGLGSSILDRSGIGHRAVDTTDVDAVAAAIGPATRLVWLETITNPTTDIADVGAIAEVAHAHGRSWQSTTPSPPRTSPIRWPGRRPRHPLDHEVRRGPLGHHGRRHPRLG